MDKIILVDKEMEPAFVRSQFDEILVKEITSLIEIDSDIAMLTYDLSTISAIIIAVERERDIKTEVTMPPQRFTFDSLVDELVDIGLYKDDDMLNSVRSVVEQGYLTQDHKGKIKAEPSAYTIVGFLDKIFPVMQGIQLIAFVMQMIDEVLSERKTLEYAMEAFYRTLKNSGVAVTREKAEKKARELALDSYRSRQMRDLKQELKEANIKRLAQQKFKEKLALNRAGGKPSFHFDGGSRLDKVKITSVFDKGPSDEEIEAEKRAREAEAERIYQESLLKALQIEEERERKLKEAEAAAKEIERKAAELAAKEQALQDAEMAALKIEQQQAELRAKEAEMAVREAELRLKEEQLKAAAVIREEELKAAAQIVSKAETEVAANNISDGIETISGGVIDDIEARIAAFEAELTIPCPLCHNGTIKQEKTETGKDYFICSEKSCRFVSWSQPYHFSCPLCKNPFLVDFQTPAGSKGLKCPRASCNFSQNHIFDPATAIAPPQSVNFQPQPADYPQQPTTYPQQPAVNYPHGHPPSQQSGYPPPSSQQPWYPPPSQQQSGYPQYPTAPPGYPSQQPAGYQQPDQQTSGAETPKKKRLVRRVKRTS